ncbi:MAG: TIGR04282 family arsenosugar biosynthesis glycosyltransferase [Actinomycetota bacterium]|nr:TIGR04282 family arsenosugar biosynthesis glycosyltransferase [Actinomycetota bacterium]
MTITALIVAKAPVAGRSKTRLVPPLSGEQAAALQRALLLDTITACRSDTDDVRLLVATEEERSALDALAPGTPVELQRGRGLADALAHGISDHVSGGPVAIISSDLPGLPAGSITRAYNALAAGVDVVLGPAMDGGYWLVAMRAAHEAPFRDIPWSTPAVWAATMRRCHDARLSTHALEPWRDVDTYADLAACRDELDPAVARHSASVLRELTEQGIIVGDEAAPRLVSSELLAASPWRAVVSDELLRTDGRRSAYTYLAVPRAVFVVAVTRARELVLVRQYRHPVRDWTLEVPAGSVEEGESALEAAQRELCEEVGGRSSSWRHLSTFYSSSAHLSLRSDAFLAEDVELTTSHPDEEESLVAVRLPIAEALARARTGEFVEGQTALAILLAASFLDGMTVAAEN